MKIAANHKGNILRRKEAEHMYIEARFCKERREQLLYRYTLLLLVNDIPEFHPIMKISLSARRLKLLVNIMVRYLRLNRIKD